MTEPFCQGDVFAGKYRVESILGKGGMGLVLGARHIGLDEPVAIKVLLPDVVAAPGMVERFLREARTASKVKSEHAVRVMDVDCLPSSGVPYIVMERLAGDDLASLGARSSTAAPLPVGEVVRWILDACEAISEAHALGIVHRDLKPGNLFLARRHDGSACVKVLDFGISKVTRGLADGHQATETGVMFGSPSYMAPEQMVSARRVDARADIWSLGVTLYQLLTGALPFRAQTAMELGVLVLHGPPPRRPAELRPDLPPPLDAAILRCLERDKDRRFASVAELVAELRPFADPPGAAQPERTAPWPPSTSEARDPAPPHGAAEARTRRERFVDAGEPPARSTRSRHARAAAIAVASALVGLGAGLSVWPQPSRDPAPPAMTPEAPTATEAAPRAAETSAAVSTAAGSTADTPAAAAPSSSAVPAVRASARSATSSSASSTRQGVARAPVRQDRLPR